MPLHVVPPAPKPDETPEDAVRKRVARRPKPVEMLQCQCGSRETIETRIGRTYKAGRTGNGTKQILCFNCMLKGRRVVLA
jgi:hypothetical protein